MTPDEIKALADLGRELWRGYRMNNTISLRLFDLMRNPQIGDLVLEVTSWRNQAWDPDSIGHLVAVEGVERAGDGVLVDRYVVAPLHEPARHQGWRNATFIALPKLEPGPDGELVDQYACARTLVPEPAPSPERTET